MTIDELDDDLKTFASLNANQGQIRLNPRIQRNLRAFVHWARELLLMGRDPAAVPFPIDRAQDLLLLRAKEYKAFDLKM